MVLGGQGCVGAVTEGGRSERVAGAAQRIHEVPQKWLEGKQERQDSQVAIA